jgi:hypothetical protein
MYTLFNVKFNWRAFTLISFLILLFFPGIGIYSLIAILISLYQFILLFNSIGHVVPVRYLLGAFMCLQMFIGPSFAYNGLDEYQFGNYKMQVPQEVYFSYVIPAVICFIVGLNIRAKKFEGEILDLAAIENFVFKNQYLPYYFIGIGFLATVVGKFSSSEFTFVFVLLSGFKFVGTFLIIIGKKDLKPLPLLLVVGATVTSTLADGLFHDLLTWLIFILAIFAIKYKPSQHIKVIVMLSFTFIVVLIQILKGDYRQAIWAGDDVGGIETFENVLEKSKDQGTFFSKKRLSESNIRINQGFIITNIMKTVPAKVPYSEGAELKQILEAAFLPRFLAPNKLTAGSRELFSKYSGMVIKRGTSMGLSSIGDAYLNFGVTGGCVFMFILGFFYSKILSFLYKKRTRYPIILLFTPLLFYYPIRPDCELQTILGHLIKGTFLVLFVMYFFRDLFEVEAQSQKRTTVSIA